MAFVLNSQNVFEYLIKRKLTLNAQAPPIEVITKSCKNFNLLVRFADDRHLLVKQERYNSQGKKRGEFHQEWRIQELLSNFPALHGLQFYCSEALDFNPDDSILVLNYFPEYFDLEAFYDTETQFPTSIAASVGKSLATIHRATWKQESYRQFLMLEHRIDQAPHFTSGLEYIKPDVFGLMCSDAIEFFKLYQRSMPLRQAIASLQNQWTSSCLIHRDLKLGNIIVHFDWQTPDTQVARSLTRIIDWERYLWGDPALDVATLVASYLKLWLNSLLISPAIPLETSLRLASVPLEQIQPSLVALMQAYLQNFPEIQINAPDFLSKVMQFTGFELINKIRVALGYHTSFTNRHIGMMQVAKTLLCCPQDSISTIFGIPSATLLSNSVSMHQKSIPF